MRSLLRVLCIACVGLGFSGAGGQAQETGSESSAAVDTCGPQREAILALAQWILDERDSAKGFTGRRFGTTAAYLLLRYDDLDFTEGMALLDKVGEGASRGPSDLEALRLAFAISKLGVEEGLRATGQTALEAFAAFSPAVLRQVILTDQGETFFNLLAALREDPALAKSFERSYYDGVSLFYWLLDQNDAYKAELAGKAEAAGEVVLAALLLASRQDPGAYYALLERHADSDLAERAGPRLMNLYLATVLHHEKPLPVEGDDAERRLHRADQFDILRAAFRMGGLAWLSILYNQTGTEAPIAEAARDFLTEIEAGRLRPRAKLEQAWVYFYDTLAREMGAEDLSQAMIAFDIPRGVRHYAGRAQATLDWMIARQALAPYLTGRADDLPPRPALLSADFDWQAWTTLAADVRRYSVGDDSGINGDPAAVVELMLTKGEIVRALHFARQSMPLEDRLWFHRDLMIRLDRLCDAYTVFPGAEMTLGGGILYVFE